ncbi:MAG TPA: cytochrome d ubiquinol oxidase subunit II [Gammaproteobacteria bacterium]|nr:cytochrome d ubiquinol oxidase subunit II [Gammaproteobacteria bacterium]
MFLDYDTLKLIWWLLVGVLLIGFALTDGFDLGVGMLLPFLGKNDNERRVIINSVGPTWEGNQVWLITAGGAIFAAWPTVYATAFSGLYVALLLVVFALFFRPVGFDYRSKIADPRWRNSWDWALFVGGFVPALVFGITFGNLLQGVPFHFDEILRSTYTGSFFDLLNPFALLAGLVSLSMLVMHGAIYLQLRTEEAVYQRAKRAAAIAALTMITSFALAGLWLGMGIDGFRILSMPPVDAAPNILAKTVEQASGAWLSNYASYPWMLMAPLFGFSGAAGALWLSARDQPGLAFISSGLSLTGVILTAGFSMFPFILPSSTDPNSSLTAWDATSSHLTLSWMFFAAIFFLPLIILYTSWVYRIMGGKVTEKQIQQKKHSVY